MVRATSIEYVGQLGTRIFALFPPSYHHEKVTTEQEQHHHETNTSRHRLHQRDLAENGKLAGEGYDNFIAEYRTFDHLNIAIGAFRKAGDSVIFVRLAFDQTCSNQPKSSSIFGKDHKFDILANGIWSTEINDAVDYHKGDDEVVVKTRVSAFHDTELGRGRGAFIYTCY